MGGSLSSEELKEKPYPKTDATLYYFRGRGLADQIRWIMAYSKVSFAGRVIDKRARFQRLAEVQLPFGQLPLLQIDGLELVQSQTIVRYLAKRANLMGTTPKEEVICDMIAETVRDLIGLVAGTPFARRRGAAALDLHMIMLREKWNARASRLEFLLEQQIKAKNGCVLVGKSVTYADVLVAHALTWYVEECGPAIVENMPRLVALQNRIVETPSLRAFIQGKQWYPLGDNDYCNAVDEVLGRRPE